MMQGPYAGYATQEEARNHCCIYSKIKKTPSCCGLDASANHAEKGGLVFLRTIAMPSFGEGRWACKLCYNRLYKESQGK